MKNYLLLIDADGIAYQAAAHHSIWNVGDYYFHTRSAAREFCNGDQELLDQLTKLGTASADESIVFGKIQKIMDRIAQRFTYGFSVPKLKAFVSGSNNFRFSIEPRYKENRKDIERPKHLKSALAFMLKEYDSKKSVDCEADDDMGVEHYANFVGEDKHTTVYCSRDKDRKTIPGLSYDPFTDKLTEISLHDADHFFYQQCMMGDRVDNIKGIPGVGPVKALKVLEDCTTELEMAEAVCKAYEEKLKLSREDAIDAMEHNGQLARIRRVEGEIWRNPLRE